MKNKILLATLAVALSGAGAYAAPMPDLAGTYYVAPSMGNLFIDHTGGNNNNLAASSFIGNVAFGYNYTNTLALQAALGITSPNVTGWLARVEGIFSIPTHSRLSPHLALGVGAIKLDSTRPIFDAGVGVNYYITDNFSVNANWRYLWELQGDLARHSMLNIGFSFVFGKNNTATAKPQALTPVQHKLLKQAQQTLRYVLPQGARQCGVGGATPQTGCVKLNGNKMVMHLDVKFATNKSMVRSKYAPAVQRLAKFMLTYPGIQAKLYGYASVIGPQGFNKQLSGWRATSVKSYLVRRGIAKSRISTISMGTRDPINARCSKTNKVDCEVNQRVEAAVSVPLKPVN